MTKLNNTLYFIFAYFIFLSNLSYSENFVYFFDNSIDFTKTPTSNKEDFFVSIPEAFQNHYPNTPDKPWNKNNYMSMFFEGGNKNIMYQKHTGCLNYMYNIFNNKTLNSKILSYGNVVNNTNNNHKGFYVLDYRIIKNTDDNLTYSYFTNILFPYKHTSDFKVISNKSNINNKNLSDMIYSDIYISTLDEIVFEPKQEEITLEPFGENSKYSISISSVYSMPSNCFDVRILNPMLEKKKSVKDIVYVFPKPFDRTINFKINLDNDTNVSLNIFDSNGILVNEVLKDYFYTKGIHYKQISTNLRGVFFYILSTDDGKNIVGKIVSK